MTGDAWSHDCRGNCLCELDRDVILVGIGRLQGSWIQQSAACLLISPWMDASVLTKGAVGNISTILTSKKRAGS